MKSLKLIILTLLLSISLSAQSGSAPPNVVPFSATPTFDISLANLQKITLTGNVTSSKFVNVQAGQNFTMQICQDGVGSRTFAWPTNVTSPPTVVATASTCTVQGFTYDGINIFPVGAATSGSSGFPVTSAQTVNSGGSIVPTSTQTGQLSADSIWYETANQILYPATPSVTVSNTGGSLVDDVYFIRLTYVGLATIVPSGEWRQGLN